jgi:PAS domain S-box-containing protein
MLGSLRVPNRNGNAALQLKTGSAGGECLSGVGKSSSERSLRILNVIWTAVAFGALAWLGGYSYLTFHSLAELFSIIVAAAVFVIAWNVRDTIDNGYLQFLGIAFLFVAAIDLAHMLAYTGRGVFPGYGTDLPTQLWIAGRGLESLSLLAAPFFLSRRPRPLAIFALYTAITALVLFSTFAWKIFPVCYVERFGLTQFKISAEYVICFLLVLALAGLLANRSKFQHSILLLLCCSILTTIISELAFTKYASVYGNSNMIGHLLKILSVVFIYKAIVETGFRRPYELLYRNLAESERKFRSAIASNMIGVVFADPITGAVTEANDEYLRIVGRTRPELEAGKINWKAITPEDILAREEEAIRGLSLSEKNVQSFEKAYVRPDGTRVPVIIGGALLDDTQHRMVAYVLDNTARKQAEQALRMSEEKFSLAFAGNPAAIALTRVEDGLFLEVNNTLLTLIGFPREEVIGHSARKMNIWPSDADVRHFVDRLNREGSIQGWEQEFRTKSGERVTTQLSAQVLNIRGEKLVLSTLVDITARKRAEEAIQKAQNDLEQKILERTEELRRANRTLRMLSECNEIVVRAQDEQALMQDICRVIVEVGGYRMVWVGYADNDDEKTVRPVASMGIEEGYLESARISWADTERGRGPTGTCIRTGEICTGRNFLEDPELAPWREAALKRGFLSSIALPLQSDGKTFGAITIYAEEPRAFDKGSDLMHELAEDLAFGIRSIRMQAERNRARQIAETRAGQLQALAAELVQAEQKERRQLARILHDQLQQLLVAAKMITSVIRGKARANEIQELADKLTETLDESIRASRSLTADLSPPVLHEKGLAASLEWLRRQMHEKHGLTLDIETEAEAEPGAEQVRTFLFDAVRELLLNVVKHARVNRAQVRTRMLANDEIELVVADKGAGFDPARLEEAHSTTGGFGLFSIRERLSYLGGRMHIDAAPVQGSRFTLIAPARLAPQAASLKASAKSASYAEPKIRVLIADDHKVVRQGLIKLLEEQPDIQVMGDAGKGYEAVEMARQLKPDVVLMDVSLPDISGLDATRLILTSCPEISVIGLSMHEENDMAASMMKAGAVAYLTKGGATGPLISTIRACTKQKITSQPTRA